MTHGAYAATIPPDLTRTAAEVRDAIVSDLGGLSELSALEAELVRRLTDFEIIANRLVIDLSTNGVLTPAGKPRPSTALLLNVTDRIVRIADMLGLKRRTKPVASLATILADGEVTR